MMLGRATPTTVWSSANMKSASSVAKRISSLARGLRLQPALFEHLAWVAVIGSLYGARSIPRVFADCTWFWFSCPLRAMRRARHAIAEA